MTNAMWNVFWGSLGRRGKAPAPVLTTPDERAARRRALAATTPLRRLDHAAPIAVDAMAMST